MQARYQDPVRGQFISQDPVFLTIGDPKQLKQLANIDQQAILADPQSLNSYSYARGNPMTLVDPGGKSPKTAGQGAVSPLVYAYNNPLQTLGAVAVTTAAVAVAPVAATVAGVALGGYAVGSALRNAYDAPDADTRDYYLGQGATIAALTVLGMKGGARSFSGDSRVVLENVQVRSFGQTIYSGSRDLSGVLGDIKNGNLVDRGVFMNDRGRLPQQSSGYYKEYAVPNTPNYTRPGAGPERIIKGQGGETYYTPDHYQTFKEIK